MSLTPQRRDEEWYQAFIDALKQRAEQQTGQSSSSNNLTPLFSPQEDWFQEILDAIGELPMISSDEARIVAVTSEGAYAVGVLSVNPETGKLVLTVDNSEESDE